MQQTPTEQVTQFLRAKIKAVYAPGAKLPSNLDLKVTYGTSAEVVRGAMKALETEGLVVVRRNYGTFVRDAQG